jgi:hypothetical protein
MIMIPEEEAISYLRKGKKMRFKNGSVIVFCGLLALLLTGCGMVFDTTSETDQLATQVANLENIVSYQATQIGGQQEKINYLATRGPVDLPSEDDVPTFTPYSSWDATILIQEGSCCAGGLVGDTVELLVTFFVIHPDAEVVEMRVMTGGSGVGEDDLAEITWEPYTQMKTYQVEITVPNWIGWWVYIQFRDADGNVSPVFSDDISLEGHLPPPTNTPGP